MFNLQVTLSDFQCRKPQFALNYNEEFIVVLRFGPIKMQLKISSHYGQLIGGKRILIDITTEQIQRMFQTYALGMFIQNNNNKFFSLLSLQNLHFTDIISGQEIYFHNDSQEIIYSAAFSIVFNDFKNPRLPNNKEAIQNHRTFNQMFKKPAVPTASGHLQTGMKTMSSFLYGNANMQQVNVQQAQKVKTNRPASGRVKKSTSVKGKASTKTMAKTSTNPYNHQPQLNNMAYTSSVPHQNITIYQPYGQQQYDDSTDTNPPLMQFTNTISDNNQKGIGLLKTQLQGISLLPESVKLMTALESKSKNLQMNNKKGHLAIGENVGAKNARIKIQQQFLATKGNNDNYINKKLGQSREISNNNKEGQPQLRNVPVDRQQLRNRAKQQLSQYQGTTNIKIPILKDGKYQFVELSQLSEQQIKKFAQKQKEIEFQEQMRREMERQLVKKEKENQRLRKELEEKEKVMRRRQEQAKREKEELLKRQREEQLTRNDQQKQLKNKQEYSDEQQSEDYEEQNKDDYDEPQENYEQNEQKYQNKHSPKYSNNNNEQDQQQNYYESDFESMHSGLKHSKASMNSQQKIKAEQSYNDSYDPDFESYSQSFLDSKLKLSASEISDTNNNYYQYKNKNK